MKKILAIMLCAMLICVTPIVAYAEEASEVTENTVTEEVATESEIEAVEPTIPEKIIGFITENYEGSTFLSLAVTIVGYAIIGIKKHKSLNGSIGILNNNAVTVAQNSAKAIDQAMAKAGAIVENSSEVVKNVLAEAASIAEMVKGYRDDIVAALDEIRKNAEEKQSLEDMLASVQKTLNISQLVSRELADEVAELLMLANIPNSKKDELYSRHRTAVDAIATAENTEVITHDGKET